MSKSAAQLLYGPVLIKAILSLRKGMEKISAMNLLEPSGTLWKPSRMRRKKDSFDLRLCVSDTLKDTNGQTENTMYFCHEKIDLEIFDFFQTSARPLKTAKSVLN